LTSKNIDYVHVLVVVAMIVAVAGMFMPIILTAIGMEEIAFIASIVLSVILISCVFLLFGTVIYAVYFLHGKDESLNDTKVQKI